MRTIVVIAHNIRSAHNVGSLLRTCEGLGVDKLYLTGYTPYPRTNDDSRLPHEVMKLTKQIAKVSLGSEETLHWVHNENILTVVTQLKSQEFTIVGLEQTANARNLPDYQVPMKLALIVGREVEGIEQEVLDMCEETVEIPMLGSKESFNVIQAASMALYHCRFYPFPSAK